MALDEAIAALRAHCNREIDAANKSRTRITDETPVSFKRLNDLLKSCDAVFRAHEETAR